MCSLHKRSPTIRWRRTYASPFRPPRLGIAEIVVGGIRGGQIVDTGDTAWVLMSSALVMLMTPALGFFYGGLVRRKNVLATIMHSFFMLCLVSVQWVLFGYTLAFGPDKC